MQGFVIMEACSCNNEFEHILKYYLSRLDRLISSLKRFTFQHLYCKVMDQDRVALALAPVAMTSLIRQRARKTDGFCQVRMEGK